MKQVIKIIHDSSASGNYYDGSVLRLTGINNASDVDGDVLMTNDCYKEIFSIHKKIAKNYQKRLSIVKISANGHSIYRTFKGVPAKYFSNNFAALSPNSIMQLFDENGIPPKEVELKKVV